MDNEELVLPLTIRAAHHAFRISHLENKLEPSHLPAIVDSFNGYLCDSSNISPDIDSDIFQALLIYHAALYRDLLLQRGRPVPTPLLPLLDEWDKHFSPARVRAY